MPSWFADPQHRFSHHHSWADGGRVEVGSVGVGGVAEGLDLTWTGPGGAKRGLGGVVVDVLNRGREGLGMGCLVAPVGDDKMPCCLLVMIGLVSVGVGFMLEVGVGRRTFLVVRERWPSALWVILLNGPCFSVVSTWGCVRSRVGGRVLWRGWEGRGTAAVVVVVCDVGWLVVVMVVRVDGQMVCHSSLYLTSMLGNTVGVVDGVSVCVFSGCVS